MIQISNVQVSSQDEGNSIFYHTSYDYCTEKGKTGTVNGTAEVYIQKICEGGEKLAECADDLNIDPHELYAQVHLLPHEESDILDERSLYGRGSGPLVIKRIIKDCLEKKVTLLSGHTADVSLRDRIVAKGGIVYETMVREHHEEDIISYFICVPLK